MAIDPDLKRLMTETVTIKAPSSRDQYNAITFGTGTDYTCRIAQTNKIVRDAMGHEKVARHKVWLAEYVTATPEYQVTLPDGTTPPIVAVEQYPDDNGNYLTCLLLGWNSSKGI